MGWAGLARQIAAEGRRQERAARQRSRAAEQAWKASQKLEAAIAARLEVEAFEAQLEELTSLHRESFGHIDWAAVARRAEPLAPVAAQADRSRSAAARAALEQHVPGFFEKLFGLKGPRRRLEAELQEALTTEQELENRMHAQHQQRVAAWREECETFAMTRDLAQKILGGDIDAYGRAIQASGCLGELMAALGAANVDMKLKLQRATLTLRVDEDAVVPMEQKALTARGGVSVKKLPAARRMEIYQDYVCGAALRAAREVLAVTPLPLALVHVEANQIDTRSGHMVTRTILSVACPREALARVNWEAVDASDLVSSLLHAMKVSRGKGFAPVEPLALEA